MDFSVSDFVWTILTKDPFPIHEYKKLAARKIGPMEIIENINQNAYCLQLLSHIHIADVFNVKHLILMLVMLLLAVRWFLIQG